MRTAQLIQASGLSKDTIRYYEQRGLIPEPQRSSNNYKLYPKSTLELLDFIATAKQLGFTLREIKNTLHLFYDEDLYCDSAIELLKDKLLQVTDSIKQLENQKKQLQGEIKYFKNKKHNK